MELLTTHSPPDSMHGSAIDWAGALVENERWLRMVVRSRMRDAHATDEVMQDFALAVLKQKAGPSDPEKVAPWLYRVAIRQTINHRRRSGRQRRLIENVAQQQGGAEAIQSSPRDWVLAEESQAGMHLALDRLSVSDRDILLLKYTEGWTYKGIAKHLGIKTKTVEHRLLKARRALRIQLREQGIEEKSL